VVGTVPIKQLSFLHFFLNFDSFFFSKKFWSKIENFGQTSKFCSKTEVLVKKRNFGQKQKLWSKIEILVKNRSFIQKELSFFLTSPAKLAVLILYLKYNFMKKFYNN